VFDRGEKEDRGEGEEGGGEANKTSRSARRVDEALLPSFRLLSSALDQVTVIELHLHLVRHAIRPPPAQTSPRDVPSCRDALPRPSRLRIHHHPRGREA
jgi:hypothetical protein